MSILNERLYVLRKKPKREMEGTLLKVDVDGRAAHNNKAI